MDFTPLTLNLGTIWGFDVLVRDTSIYLGLKNAVALSLIDLNHPVLYVGFIFWSYSKDVKVYYFREKPETEFCVDLSVFVASRR